MTYDFKKTLAPFADRPEEEIEEMRERLNQYIRLVVRIAHDPEAQKRFDQLTKTESTGTLKGPSKA